MPSYSQEIQTKHYKPSNWFNLYAKRTNYLHWFHGSTVLITYKTVEVPTQTKKARWFSANWFCGFIHIKDSKIIKHNQNQEDFDRDITKSTIFPDIDKPCFACGESSSIYHNDGKTHYCGSCHSPLQKP